LGAPFAAKPRTQINSKAHLKDSARSAGAMPLAFQLIGRSLDEALLLKIADAYQSETSWHKKIPQLR
jgi:Asp-tRNA(Asn)/Glu-tRNA(Gln) amidotransferase A subunit family amidase